jgi:hypothetical protein
MTLETLAISSGTARAYIRSMNDIQDRHFRATQNFVRLCARIREAEAKVASLELMELSGCAHLVSYVASSRKGLEYLYQARRLADRECVESSAEAAKAAEVEETITIVGPSPWADKTPVCRMPPRHGLVFGA